MTDTTPQPLKIAQFLAKSSASFQLWKETEPELLFLFERNYKALSLRLQPTKDENIHLIELELPEQQAGKLSSHMNDNSLTVEIDKVHGIDPVSGKKDVKLSKFQILDAPTMPRNKQLKSMVESCENKLVELEIKERTRTIDVKFMMERLMSFQVDMFKKFELLDKKIDEVTSRLEERCEKLEKSIKK